MKTIFAFVILLAAFAGIKALHAQNVTTVPVKRLSYILPPVEFDHYYEGDLTIKIVDTLDELYALCAIKNDTMLACALPAGKSCIVIMVRDEVMRKRGWTTGVIFRHEIGHCNGWAPDNVHVGQRPLESNTHWVPEAERIKIPSDRLQKATKIKEGLAGPR
jgi:hypothetical protein